MRHLERFLVFYDGVHHMYRNVHDMENLVKVRSIPSETTDKSNT